MPLAGNLNWLCCGDDLRGAVEHPRYVPAAPGEKSDLLSLAHPHLAVVRRRRNFFSWLLVWKGIFGGLALPRRGLGRSDIS